MGVNTPFKPVYQHYFKSPMSGDTLSFTCPRMMAKQKCPLCMKAAEFSKSRSKADKDAAREFMPRRRIMANIIDRQDPEAGPKIIGFGKTIQESLVAIRSDEDAGGDYTHPTSGFDIVIERKGAGLNTKYSVIPARQDSPMGNMEWIAMQHDLEQFGAVESYEDLVAKLREATGGSTAAEPSQQLPEGRKARGNVIDASSEEGGGNDQMGW